MMPEVTSMFDLFNRTKTDERYRRLVIAVYTDACYPQPNCAARTFENANRWIDDWIDGNVSSGRNHTCQAMVDYANEKIYLIDRKNEV